MLIRFNLDLAIPAKVALEQKAAIDAMKLAISKVKKLAVKINEGKDNEEATVTAKFHKCHHDEPGSTISCADSEVDI